MKDYRRGCVYHIVNPNNPDDINDGYIGVVLEHKGPLKRFREHMSDGKRMKHVILNNNVTEKHVKIIFSGDIDECYKLENVLRPKQKMGWNLSSGGKGVKYKSEIEDLSKHRSSLQKERMANTELKIQQGISFKENYYSSNSSIELRKKRAKEHMANPEKREKCLNALHKKIECPHCNFSSNAGNLKKHIRSKHS